jgi:hypothetical protein
MRQVLAEGMRLAATGMVLGVPLSIYAAKLAQVAAANLEDRASETPAA